MPKRELQGIVVSDKADKTVVVKVERRIVHPVYKKIIKRSKRFAAHDENNKQKWARLFEFGNARPDRKEKHGKLSI